METIRTKAGEASKIFGEKKKGFGGMIKYLVKPLDKNQCTRLLEDCQNDVKAALPLLNEITRQATISQ
ncbi:hypothetical protein FRB90_003684 [Tulasnella sp. 427]|nr:hypothetical protein FRB90_003684 [Tulasnella sp. 427]